MAESNRPIGGVQALVGTALGSRRVSRRRDRGTARAVLAVVSGAVLGLIGLAVLVGPILLPVANTIDLADRSLAPSFEHIMGTDDLGRDQFARILEGGRLSLAVALAAVTSAVLVGTIIGGIAGYAGGVVDNLLMRIVDAFYSLPALFVVIILITLVGSGFWPIVIAIALFGWMNTARLVRAGFLAHREAPYVQAARGLGASHLRLAVVHILPAVLGPIVASATIGIAVAVLTESALSFLGLGFQPPQATWGGMLFEAQRATISQGEWWRGLFPGLMIFVVVLAVNYLGDELSDRIDVRRVR